MSLTSIVKVARIATRKTLRALREPKVLAGLGGLWAAIFFALLLLGILRGPGLDLVIWSRLSLAEEAQQGTLPLARLYWKEGEGVSHENSIARVFRPNVNRSNLRFPLPSNVEPKFRIDPNDRGPGQWEIHGLRLVDRLSGRVLEEVKLDRLSPGQDSTQVQELPGWSLVKLGAEDPRLRINLTKEYPKAWEAHQGLVAYGLWSLLRALGMTAVLFLVVSYLGATNLFGWGYRRLRIGTRQLARNRWAVLRCDTPIDQALLVLFAALIGLLAWQVKEYSESFRELQHPFVPQFADPATPVSDALYIWMRGAMYYYMADIPFENTYRPILGLFHAAYLKLHLNIAWVPAAVFWSVMALLAVLFAHADTRGRAYLVCAVAAVAVPFYDTYSHAAPHVFGPGIFVYGMSVMGVFLVMGTLVYPGRLHEAGALLGIVLLSTAGTVRGPQLLGAAILLGILLLTRIRIRTRANLIYCGLAVALFLTPWFIDSRIRNALEIEHNGWAAIHSAVATPDHSWDSATYENVFLKELPDEMEDRPAYYKDLLQKFLAFRLSAEGWKDLAVKLWERSYLDGRSFFRPMYQWIALGMLSAWLAIVLVARTRGPHGLREKGIRSAFLVAHCLLPALLVQLERLNPTSVGVVILVYTALVLPLIAWRWKLWLTLGVLLFGLGSVIFHSCIGMTGSVRAAGTYNYYIYLSWFLAPLELMFLSLASWNLSPRRGLAVVQSQLVHPWSMGVVAGWILFLFLGNFLIRPDSSRILRDQFMPETNDSLVVKLSNKPSLDRSLYLDRRKGWCFYTPYDGLAPGFLAVKPEGFELTVHGYETLIEPLSLKTVAEQKE